MRKYSFISLILILMVLCLSVGRASGPDPSWVKWVKADLSLSKALNLLNADLIDCGKTISLFSQGRISKVEAEKKLKALAEKSSAQFSKISKLDNSGDQNLYACGVDLAGQQLKQIKASRELLKKDDVERRDILALQGQQGRLVDSQSRFYRARRNSVKTFLIDAKKLSRKGNLSRGKVVFPNLSLIKYYELEENILDLQIEQLKISQILIDNLQKLAKEEKNLNPIDLAKVERLRGRSAALVVDNELVDLSKAYAKEMGSFYKTAEAVKLLQQDLSVDSLSRLNRWQVAWQNDSQAASVLSAALAEKYLP